MTLSMRMIQTQDESPVAAVSIDFRSADAAGRFWRSVPTSHRIEVNGAACVLVRNRETEGTELLPLTVYAVPYERSIG